MGTRLPQAFRPFDGNTPTVTLVASSATSNVDLGAAAPEYRIYNSGSAVAFLVFGRNSSVTASTATGMPLPPGAVEFFRPPAVVSTTTDYWLAAITSAGAATLYITPGEGN